MDVSVLQEKTLLYLQRWSR